MHAWYVHACMVLVEIRCNVIWVCPACLCKHQQFDVASHPSPDGLSSPRACVTLTTEVARQIARRYVEMLQITGCSRARRHASAASAPLGCGTGWKLPSNEALRHGTLPKH